MEWLIYVGVYLFVNAVFSFWESNRSISVITFNQSKLSLVAEIINNKNITNEEREKQLLFLKEKSNKIIFLLSITTFLKKLLFFPFITLFKRGN